MTVQQPTSLLHFTKGTKNLCSRHDNPPQMGYRWVRLDPKITPGWKQIQISGFRIPKIRKTGKFRNFHVTYQIKALDALVHVNSLNFRNSGKNGKNSGKTRKTHENLYFVVRRATTHELHARLSCNDWAKPTPLPQGRVQNWNSNFQAAKIHNFV